ncbi:hypothetical protein [Methylocystis hirsuta]|uniref:hypothetical protein n=1 Tax=Methylocystis hirsuta TaxID=369798 RepID=UPI0011CE3A4D|nr:hypothetical protein [Methylocystis hirsuta]
MSYGEIITAAKDLAVAIGVPGACLLIISLGVARKPAEVVTAVRGIINDFWEHRRKSRELDARIERETIALGREIAQATEKVKKLSKTEEGS